MLTFNHILCVEDVDPKCVRLVRHHDTQSGKDATLYSLWRAHDGRFEDYQRIQSKKKFSVGDLLASFVVTPAPRNATLFVGLYKVQGLGKAPPGTRDPLRGHDVSGQPMYDIDLDKRLGDYRGRLVIDWGKGARTWVQLAAEQDKPVREIRDDQEPPFPGFAKFRCDVDELPGLYPGWLDVLKNIKGVYLLVDKQSGKQYVGSARGEDSLYGRLIAYADGGHGGNVELKALGRRSYQVSVLEIVGMGVSDQRIEEIESGWKDKLLSGTFGLNKN
jgi:hypothetical protein